MPVSGSLRQSVAHASLMPLLITGQRWWTRCPLEWSTLETQRPHLRQWISSSMRMSWSKMDNSMKDTSNFDFQAGDRWSWWCHWLHFRLHLLPREGNVWSIRINELYLNLAVIGEMSVSLECRAALDSRYSNIYFHDWILGTKNIADLMQSCSLVHKYKKSKWVLQQSLYSFMEKFYMVKELS